MVRSKPRLSAGAMLFLIGLAAGFSGDRYVLQGIPGVQSDSPRMLNGSTTYPVIRVVDGDTVVLLIQGEEVKVRLIGVDTPETVKPNSPVETYGPQASTFTKNLLEGEDVFLEYNEDDRKDRYGRDLAFIYRAPDGLFVNLELIRQGYAKAYRKAGHKHKALFEGIEKEAKEKGKGLWKQ